MFDYKDVFRQYAADNGLDISLSFDMPAGYEEAYGTFDQETATVFINARMLENAPDSEKAFYLFHELRHASQYLCPEEFSDAVVRSARYVIMYDGTCYRITDGSYLECRLEGSEELFTDLYLGQPYEADANRYAYEQTEKIFGGSRELRELYGSWMPKRTVPDETYRQVYDLIDKEIRKEHPGAGE